MKASRMAVVFISSMLLTACPTTNIKPPQAPDALPAIAVPDLQGADLFAVKPGFSDVQVHVFRGGTLARLGHNHVITSKHVSGRVWIHPSTARSGFELEFPVGELIVDDPQARAAAGGEFPGEISADDRQGTRNNMLRAEVLDADNHPIIRLQSVRVTGSLQQAQITTRITIKGVARDVVVPAAVAIEGNRLTAAGEFDIRQTDFGMKPFSIGLGALEVQDRLHLEFRIVAVRR